MQLQTKVVVSPTDKLPITYVCNLLHVTSHLISIIVAGDNKIYAYKHNCKNSNKMEFYYAKKNLSKLTLFFFY